MSTPQFFATPGYGELALDERHYHQAVRIGDRVEISGQGGWDDKLNIEADLGDEIRLAFENVERVLNSAGATWRDVVHVNTYHVLREGDSIHEDHNPIVIEEFRRRMPDRAPIWTELGVAALGHPDMRIEIRVTAIISDSGSQSSQDS